MPRWREGEESLVFPLCRPRGTLRERCPLWMGLRLCVCKIGAGCPRPVRGLRCALGRKLCRVDPRHNVLKQPLYQGKVHRSQTLPQTWQWFPLVPSSLYQPALCRACVECCGSLTKADRAPTPQSDGRGSHECVRVRECLPLLVMCR